MAHEKGPAAGESPGADLFLDEGGEDEEDLVINLPPEDGAKDEVEDLVVGIPSDEETEDEIADFPFDEDAEETESGEEFRSDEAAEEGGFEELIKDLPLGGEDEDDLVINLPPKEDAGDEIEDLVIEIPPDEETEDEIADFPFDEGEEDSFAAGEGADSGESDISS
ncbi:MAG: hypothetical protein LBH51_10015 [Treponema sp.]|jgi:hypothetical protein|nr:hypothetical protein [Treponema sp.]